MLSLVIALSSISIITYWLDDIHNRWIDLSMNQIKEIIRDSTNIKPVDKLKILDDGFVIPMTYAILLYFNSLNFISTSLIRNSTINAFFSKCEQIVNYDPEKIIIHIDSLKPYFDQLITLFEGNKKSIADIDSIFSNLVNKTNNWLDN